MEYQYPRWHVVIKKRNFQDGYFEVHDENDLQVINAEPFRSKKMFYTTESGYSYNHPYSRARNYASLIAHCREMKAMIDKVHSHFESEQEAGKEDNLDLLDELSEVIDSIENPKVFDL